MKGMINVKVVPKIFGWMFLGLLVTFVTGFILSMSPYAVNNVLSSLGGFGIILLAIIEIGLVIFLSARINKMSPLTAKICFLIYSFVTGFTFSVIFIAYDMQNIIFTFLIAAVVFALLALIGMTTKKDLTKLGTYLFMILLAVIICLIVNIFMQNSTFDLIISIVMVLIFFGFTAYDMQTTLKMQGMMEEDNLAIYGALNLYLDFINIFLNLLDIFNRD